MGNTHPSWLAYVRSFASIISTDFKGSGLHFTAFNGVILGSKRLWIKPWPGMCNHSLFSAFISQCPFCFCRGVEWIIEKVDDEECNDVDFKNDLVVQDIRPIGGLCRVVLGTIMNQEWVPLEYKALLFCFSTDRTEDEVHHAFCRFSCNRNINIFQMWVHFCLTCLIWSINGPSRCLIHQLMRNTCPTLSLFLELFSVWSFIWYFWMLS